jgi:1-acyl-sn-glycerol-3-phosphate acyltransferase
MDAQDPYAPARFGPRGTEFAQAAFRTAYRLFGKLEVRGLENLPTTGGYIQAANHMSRTDPPILFFNLPKGRQMTVLAADKYRSTIFHWFLELMPVIYVRRGSVSRDTIRAAVRLLSGGGVLGVAPEGTRSMVTHALQEGKTGAAYMAIAARVPVIPVAVTGTEHVVRNILHLRRTNLMISYGKPLMPPVAEGGGRSALVEQFTAEIMCQIAALMPPQYWGVYADHPRLKEILASAGR